MTRTLGRLTLVIAVLAASAVILPGPLYHYADVGLATVFRVMAGGAYAGVLAIILGVVTLARPRLAAATGVAVWAALGILLGGFAFGVPYALLAKAKTLPAIHDITTDTVNPPQFQPDVLALRAAAHAVNSTRYAGPSIAALQEKAYPDIRPMVFNLPDSTVFKAADQVVEKLGWRMVAEQPTAGLIEASDTTPWFGFTDDVVIRIESHGARTRLDIRSLSRVGESDLGKNAERIRAFRSALDQQLGLVAGA